MAASRGRFNLPDQFAGQSKDEHRWRFAQARGLMIRKDFTASRKLIEEMITQAPKNPLARELLAHALLMEGRDTPALVQALKDVLALDPTNGFALANLPLALQKMQRRVGQARVSGRRAPNSFDGKPALAVASWSTLHYPPNVWQSRGHNRALLPTPGLVRRSGGRRGRSERALADCRSRAIPLSRRRARAPSVRRGLVGLHVMLDEPLGSLVIKPSNASRLAAT